jgi:hypothetical protein
MYRIINLAGSDESTMFIPKGVPGMDRRDELKHGRI